MRLEKALRKLADDVEWVLDLDRDPTPQDAHRVLLFKARLESAIIRLQELLKDLDKDG